VVYLVTPQFDQTVWMAWVNCEFAPEYAVGDADSDPVPVIAEAMSAYLL